MLRFTPCSRRPRRADTVCTPCRDWEWKLIPIICVLTIYEKTLSQLKVVSERAFIDSRDQSLSAFREMPISNGWFNGKTLQRERDQKKTCLLINRDRRTTQPVCLGEALNFKRTGPITGLLMIIKLKGHFFKSRSFKKYRKTIITAGSMQHIADPITWFDLFISGPEGFHCALLHPQPYCSTNSAPRSLHLVSVTAGQKHPGLAWG